MVIAISQFRNFAIVTTYKFLNSLNEQISTSGLWLVSGGLPCGVINLGLLSAFAQCQAFGCVRAVGVNTT